MQTGLLIRWFKAGTLCFEISDKECFMVIAVQDVKCTVCIQIFAVRLVLRDAEVVEVADKL